MFRFFLRFLTILLLTTPTAFAFFPHGGGGGSGGGSDPTANVLPSYNDTYANWSKAGLASLGGIPVRSTQCGPTVTPSGIIPPASGDDASLINAAITACPAGDYVLLGSGTFQLSQSEYIALNKSVTLRGSGSPSNTCGTLGGNPCWPTVINQYDGAIPDWQVSSTQTGGICGVNSSSTAACSAAQGVILMSPTPTYVWGWGGCALGTSNPTTCGSAIAADVAQGATTVQVASTSNFSVGMSVLIAESPEVVSTANPIAGGAAVLASSDWLNASGAPATLRLEGGDIPGSYSFFNGNNQWLNQEIHIIKSIGTGPCPGVNCTLTFDDPLTIAFRQSGGHTATVMWPTSTSAAPSPFLEQAGVENLSITKAAASGVEIVFCAYCWVKNVDVGNWTGGAINTSYSVRADIEGNFFHDCADCENNGNEYPVGISSAATETYLANNIVVRGGKGMVGRAANTAVVAYNYVDDTMYMGSVIGDYWMDMDVNGSHYAGTHHFLFEGNWGDNCDGDETHGNSVYHVFFRNDCTGLRTDFTDQSIGNYPVSDTGATEGFQTQGWTYNATAGSNILTTTTPNVSLQAGTIVIVPDTTHGYWTWTVQTSCFNCTSFTMSSNALFNETNILMGFKAPPVPLRAAGPMAFNYWYAYVDNVLGTSNQTTTANGWEYKCAFGSPSGQTNKCIWMSGWVGSELPAPDPNLATSVSPNYLFKNSNYDYVSATNDSTNGYSNTMPNSFYVASTPTFFTAGTSCTYPWPWVTPQSATKIQQNSCGGSGLPAKARFDAGTPFAQP